jgi:kinesin family protein C1
VSPQQSPRKRRTPVAADDADADSPAAVLRASESSDDDDDETKNAPAKSAPTVRAAKPGIAARLAALQTSSAGVAAGARNSIVTGAETSVADRVEQWEKHAREAAQLKDEVAALQRAASAARVSTAALLEELTAERAAAEAHRGEAARLLVQVGALQAELTDAHKRLAVSEAVRADLLEQVLTFKSQIRVFCRIRPPASGNVAESTVREATLEDDGEEQLSKVLMYAPLTASGARQAPQLFGFDGVFGPHDDNGRVYSHVVPLVQSVLDGGRASLFAYGQAGAGKTYTMGTDIRADGRAAAEAPVTNETRDLMRRSGARLSAVEFAPEVGVVPRAVHDLFASFKAQRARGRRCELAVRVLEVYCDDVFALVPARAVERGGKPVPVEIGLVHGRNGTLVPEPLGVPPVAVATEEAFYALYAEASAARRVRSTQLNDYSSQSHFIVQLFVTTTDDATELCGVLTLVDLAGSERIKQSGVEGVGRKEAIAINGSLMTLGLVASALSGAKRGNAATHVPYRNSTLTYLLQECFRPRARVAFIVSLAPENSAALETLSSIRFAQRVNEGETGTT